MDREMETPIDENINVEAAEQQAEGIAGEETIEVPDSEIPACETVEGEVVEENAESEQESDDPGIRAKLELEKKDAKIAELNDKYMRTLAEYENYRRRTDKEKADIYSFAVRDVMAKILPVLDNLERGVAAIPEEEKDASFAQGLIKIEKQFGKALDDIGVKQIEAMGQAFDPKLHNAVMHVEDPELDANVVAEDLMKGYTYKEAVIRPSMVKVAN